jgi:transposase
VKNITTIGLDLAKNLFQVHGVDERGKAVLRKALKRAEVVSFFAKLLPCLVGMEACGSAHFWARKLSALGHTVKLMAPQFVKPYVKSNKNDARDAEAICEAVARPNMRFVALKTVEQQALLGLHRARQGFVSARTAQSNQIRGLLTEFGIVMPKGISCLERRMPEILEDAENGLLGLSRELFARLYAHFKELDRQVAELERQIKAWHRESVASQRLEAIPGIGPLSASALVASIGDAKAFKNGRQLAAWLGLVPRQHSSGGKEQLLGISKRGDTYLRTLLIHGARSVLLSLKRRGGAAEGWLARLAARRNPNIAAAFDYLRNVNSGHPGSITSIHAGSCELAFEQLVLLVKQSNGGRELARHDIKSLLYLLVDVVIQFGVERHERFIKEIWYQPRRRRRGLAEAG